jgi:transcriptional regulator with XRE-family HTH domain
MNVAEKIRKKRKEIHISQVQLAYVIGVSDKTLRRWELGEREPSASELLKLAAALNTSVAYLVDEKKEDLTDNSPNQRIIMSQPEISLIGETNNPKHKEHQELLDIHHLPGDSQTTTKGHLLNTLNKYRPASLEDFARVRESSRNVESLDERDLNAAAEMLRASLEAIEREQLNRTIQQDGVAG